MDDPVAKRITGARAPLWRIDLSDDRDSPEPQFDWLKLLLSIDPLIIGCAFRGVSYDCIDRILETGIDVAPPDSVIYVDELSKAWEYGRWPKVIMALDWKMLSQTFVEVPSTTPTDKLEELRAIYPTELWSRTGEQIWFSRLHKDDRRVTTEYEVAYARWIPENQSKALRAVMIFARPKDRVDPRHAA